MKLTMLVLAGAAALVFAGTLASASTTGTNGRIVFVQPAPGRLWLVNADGSGQHKLTVEKGPRLDDDAPDWSPNGSQIVFQRCQNRCQLWTVKADGSGSRPLACEGDCSTGSWSPNGKQIAFVRAWGPVQKNQIQHAEVYVMDANGSGAHQLTHVTDTPFTADVAWPAWSPDGKQIAFEVHHSSLGKPAGGRAVFVVGSDGTGLRQLTPWNLNGGGRIDWSPSGSSILFRSIAGNQDQHGNLYTIHPDGSQPTALTRYPAPKTINAGSFSPDGKWIVFSRFSPGSSYPAIFVMRANGTGIRQITHGKVGFVPDWGPAGT